MPCIVRVGNRIFDEEDNSVSTPKVMRRKGQVLATKMIQVPKFEGEEDSGFRE